MSEQDAVTRVRVVTSLEATGKQAQFGRGVMSDIAAKLTDQFAACLAERVRGPAPVPDGATPAQAPAATTTPEPENTATPQPLRPSRRAWSAPSPGSYPHARTVL
jgi:hypothetical protein